MELQAVTMLSQGGDFDDRSYVLVVQFLPNAFLVVLGSPSQMGRLCQPIHCSQQELVQFSLIFILDFFTCYQFLSRRV